MKSFKTINTSDLDLSKVQDNVGAALSQVIRSTIVDGALLEGVSLLSGQDNPVPHKLGRKLRLWIVARQNTNSNVWEVTSPAPDSLLNLRCGSSCTVSIWVA